MSNCRYCGAEIEWEDKIPFNVTGGRHSCSKKPAAAKPCKYECGTMISWSEKDSAYIDNEGDIHTKELCQQFKSERNDHGNESYSSSIQNQLATASDSNEYIDHTRIMGARNESFEPKQLIETPKEMFARVTKGEYVDHTQGQKLKLKTITDPTPEGMDLKYNNFGKEHKIVAGQSHVTGSQYTIVVFYEETK